MYARDESTGGIYTPYHGDRIRDTNAFRNLLTQIGVQSSVNGASKFPNAGNTMDRDFYYAIHKYDYTYGNGYITIKDVYDFAYNSNYEGIVGTAVNTMALAQLLGIIVPYDVRIKASR